MNLEELQSGDKELRNVEGREGLLERMIKMAMLGPERGLVPRLTPQAPHWTGWGKHE